MVGVSHRLSNVSAIFPINQVVLRNMAGGKKEIVTRQSEAVTNSTRQCLLLDMLRRVIRHTGFKFRRQETCFEVLSRSWVAASAVIDRRDQPFRVALCQWMTRWRLGSNVTRHGGLWANASPFAFYRLFATKDNLRLEYNTQFLPRSRVEMPHVLCFVF